MRAGTFYNNGHKNIKIILTISHQDHDIKNNKLSNLRVLCLGCHMKYDRNQHLNTIKKNKEKKFGKQLKLDLK